MRGGKIIERLNHYTIDAEIGLLGIHTYEIKEGSRKVFNTEGDVFPETSSREHYKTVCFGEVVLFFRIYSATNRGGRRGEPRTAERKAVKR